ncbi:MAG: M48 family metallopeptidase [Chloroflexia bacterium]
MNGEVEIREELDAGRQEAARRYARSQRALSFVELGVMALLLGLLVVTGLSEGVRDWADGFGGPRPLTVALYGIALGGGFFLLTLPLDFYSGYLLPKRYGLVTQSVGGWALDTVKGLILTGVVGIVGLEALYLLLDLWPEWWWVAMAGLMWLFSVGVTWLAPLLLMPLFYKFRSLDDPELVARLTRLAERAGARVQGVYVMDMSSRTTAANAMLAGLGGTRRIILGDTLLANYTHDEIETVLAHELAHHVHNDLLLGLAAQAVIVTGGMWAASVLLAWGVGSFGFRGVGDVAGLPLFVAAMGIFGLVTMPVVNFLSRSRERAADLYALRTTGNAGAFRSVMLKLAGQNLSDAEPPAWVRVLFYSHPPIGERVRMGEGVGNAKRET